MPYVALFYADNDLGRTILCPSWQSAVDACISLAKEQGEELSDRQIEDLSSEGETSLSIGRLHIGGLEIST